LEINFSRYHFTAPLSVSSCSFHLPVSHPPVPSPLSLTTETCRTQGDHHLETQLTCCCSDRHPA